MPRPRSAPYLILALLAGLLALGACQPTPAPSPQPNSHPAPTDPRKAEAGTAATVTPLEPFS